MSCNSCRKKYGLFLKEHGCSNCGFSFCSKCLNHSVVVPKLGSDKKGKVCQACFDKINQKQPDQIIPPDRFFKRLEQLEKQQSKTKPSEHENSSTSSDNEIAAKLKSLRGEAIISLQNDSDIAQRLAGLRGVEYKEYSNKEFINSKDNRSEQEQINDLLNQYGEENVINESVGENVDPIKDIENRLAKLREGRSSSTKITKPDHKLAEELEESEDEETVAKKMVQKFMAEAALPSDSIEPDEKEFFESIPKPPKGESEELPWCTICNEDAILRCESCENDLFCKICFKEVHDDDEEYLNHKTVPYRNKK